MITSRADWQKYKTGATMGMFTAALLLGGLFSSGLAAAASPPARIVFGSVASTEEGVVSAQMNLQFLNGQDAKTVLLQTGKLTLSSSSASGRFIYASQPSGERLSSPASVTINKGWSTKNFYYVDSTPGVHTISALLTDASGLSLMASTTVTIQATEPIKTDQTPPAAPDTMTVNLPQPVAAITNMKDVTVTGTAAANAQVTACFMRQGGSVIGTLSIPAGECLTTAADEAGVWHLLIPARMLAVGGYQMRLIAASPNSSASLNVNIIVDDTAPVVMVEAYRQPRIAGSPLHVQGLLVNFADIKSLYVYVDGTKISRNLTENIGPKGEWSFDLPGGLAAGSYTITAVAEDGAGNLSSQQNSPYAAASLTVQPRRAEVPPAAPSPPEPVARPVSTTPPAPAKQPLIAATAAPQAAADTAVLGADTTANNSVQQPHEVGQITPAQQVAAAKVNGSAASWLWWAGGALGVTGAWLAFAAAVRRWKAGRGQV